MRKFLTGILTNAFKFTGGTPADGKVLTSDSDGDASWSDTLSAVRINPRVSSATSASTLSPDISAYDQYDFTALAVNLAINAPTGTPTDGEKLLFRFRDSGAPRTLTWNAIYAETYASLPTETVPGEDIYIGVIYNAAEAVWDVVAGLTGAGGGAGDVTGPASSTDNAVARYDSTTGKIIQNSGVTVDDSNNLSANGVYANAMGTDTISEVTSGAGVTIDSVLIKDGLVDGRDVSVDGTKLNTIETSADVTDAANVAAAGAIMDGDFSTNGSMHRTASGTYISRTLTGTANRITVTNGDGVSGNPTFDVGSNVYTVGGTDASVADGGTGRSTSTTAYGVIAAGTTATGAHQTIAPGNAGQVLTSNGTSALGSFQDLTTIRKSVSQTAHGLSNFEFVRLSGANYVKAQADSGANAEVIGMVINSTTNAFTLVMQGQVTGLTGLTAGTVYFLSPSSAGVSTSTEPSTGGQVSKPIFIADTTTSGYVISHRGMVIPPGATSVAAEVANLLYPIGSIYTNAVDATNPATLLGFGTWSAFASGRVAVGLDSGQTEFDTLGETGGHKDMQAHKHTFWGSWRGDSGGTTGSQGQYGSTTPGGTTTADTPIGTAGTGNAGNLQPYVVVHMWRRTA